ncbi:MAG: ADP-ribosylglycohydrolase family protein [Coriobacteriales bacterium]|jgi:ADP-ribosylglycohydrolase|nr:ADP-ribosylglycohydrolase family protein [Coriobacteriales bacterium]
MNKRNLGRNPYYAITELDYGILGLAVGDALGVPVEFSLRGRPEPVLGMRGYGSFDLPPGTWSDDTSMALCLADSIAQTGGIDYADIMERFSAWLNRGQYTPEGAAFDVGNTCRDAISRFDTGVAPLECGGTREKDNGNGSLMRILPLVFYLRSRKIAVASGEGRALVHNVSALTHAHPRSKLACVIYCRCAELLMEEYEAWRSGLPSWCPERKLAFLSNPPVEEMQAAIAELLGFYACEPEYAGEVALFAELAEPGFLQTPEASIGSRGYVVDTLRTALWCFWRQRGYRDTVLAAVNLGGDSDTNAAVAGGLAGVWYREGTDLGIPDEWRQQLVNRSLIDRICSDLSYRLGYNGDLIVEEPAEDEWRDAEMEDIAERFKGCMLGITCADSSGDISRLMLLVAAGMAGAKERAESRGIGDFMASGTGQMIDYWLACGGGGGTGAGVGGSGKGGTGAGGAAKSGSRDYPGFVWGRISERLAKNKKLFTGLAQDGDRPSLNGSFVAGLAPVGLFLFDSPKHAFLVGRRAGSLITEDEDYRLLAGVYAAAIALLVDDAGSIEFCVEQAKTCSDSLPGSDAAHNGVASNDAAAKRLDELLQSSVLQAGLKGALLGKHSLPDCPSDAAVPLKLVEDVAEMLFDEANCYYMTDVCERIRCPRRRTHSADQA